MWYVAIGTSMSAPAAAGSALLVREYFSDTTKRFWTAVCNSAYRLCLPFTPSGVLVKAILLHSGSQMVCVRFALLRSLTTLFRRCTQEVNRLDLRQIMYRATGE